MSSQFWYLAVAAITASGFFLGRLIKAVRGVNWEAQVVVIDKSGATAIDVRHTPSIAIDTADVVQETRKKSSSPTSRISEKKVQRRAKKTVARVDKELASRIHEIRVESCGQYGLPELAKSLKITSRKLSALEDARQKPSNELVERIAEVTQVNLLWLKKAKAGNMLRALALNSGGPKSERSEA